MNGIADHIRWLGRFTFDELPMNEVDVFVLCVISYFDLSPVTEATEGPVRVADCARALAEGSVKLQITGGDMGYSEILEAACASKRFGELLISDYESIVKSDPPIQFSAMTISYRDKWSLLAFRGTDETIPGWREDFMISFMETDAQRLAAAYAQDRIRPGHDWYIAGHSKGGNLALYAASRLDEAAWDTVRRVYILDGPGLCPEVMDTSVVERIDAKTTRIVPEYSVIGKLFEPAITDTRIVRSSQKGILQHGLSSWGVEYGELAAAKEHDKQSVFLMQILNRWIGSIGQREREILTADLFDALAAGGAVTLSDIAGSGPEGFAAVLVRMFQTSSITKKVIRDLPAQAVSTVWKQLVRDTGNE